MITALLVLLFLPLLICWGLWLLFALLALLPKRPALPTDAAAAPTIDILIPAHDEELLLPRLLNTLTLQSTTARIGNLLVIADHCSDRTADLARHAGAQVLERNTGPRGKPAALRDGLAWLAAHTQLPPENRAVLILDADCTVSPNLVDQIAATMSRGHKVVQAAYLLDAHSPHDASQKLHTPAMIAFALKNVIRPAGMARIGIPTQLFGTGMCFRADVLASITFEDHLTEDLAISHDLLLNGIPPAFVPNAMVRSPLPTERSAMSTQKLRWETGQIRTWAGLPSMLSRLLARGRFPSVAALLDWSAPPVALALFFWLGATFATALLVAIHLAATWTLLLPAVSLLFLTAYVIVGGAQVSGVAAVGRLFLGVPRFAFWKVHLYGRMLLGKGATAWQRTPRSAAQLSEKMIIGSDGVDPK